MDNLLVREKKKKKEKTNIDYTVWYAFKSIEGWLLVSSNPLALATRYTQISLRINIRVNKLMDYLSSAELLMNEYYEL